MQAVLLEYMFQSKDVDKNIKYHAYEKSFYRYCVHFIMGTSGYMVSLCVDISARIGCITDIRGVTKGISRFNGT